MFKRILLGLDGSDYSTAATLTAFKLARRHGASVTGVAIVDTEFIESKGVGAGIGSIHYAERLQESLEEKAEKKVKAWLKEFHELGDEAGITHRRITERGAPVDALLEDLNYHDLLVIGIRTFFTGEGKEPDHQFLDYVADSGSGPVLCVQQKPASFKTVLAAVTGKRISSSALQKFLELDIDDEIKIHLLHCNDDEEQGNKILQQYSQYCTEFGHSVSIHLEPVGDISEVILEKAAAVEAGTIVMGGHDTPGLFETFLGGTTETILDNEEFSVFSTTKSFLLFQDIKP